MAWERHEGLSEVTFFLHWKGGEAHVTVIQQKWVRTLLVMGPPSPPSSGSSGLCFSMADIMFCVHHSISCSKVHRKRTSQPLLHLG